MKPIAWTIAGTDPSGGAGIQADLKVFNRLGVHGGSVITALLAQNTLGVQAIEPLSPAMVAAQLRSLESDLPPRTAKTGMLASAPLVTLVADWFGAHPDVILACDPVLAASDGTPLLDAEGETVFRVRLLPRTDLLLPNLPEAERLLGRTIPADDASVETAADDLLALGARAVWLKGGHRAGPWAQDFLTDGATRFWLTSPRQSVTHTHGTGCTLSAAWTAFRALGRTWDEAARLSKAYLNQGLRLGGGIGRGRGPLAHAGWPDDPGDQPRRTAAAADGRAAQTGK